MDEKTLLGSYSSSFGILDEVTDLVFGGYRNGFDLTQLISHRFPLEEAVAAIDVASHPKADSMKIMIEPVSGRGSTVREAPDGDDHEGRGPPRTRRRSHRTRADSRGGARRIDRPRRRGTHLRDRFESLSPRLSCAHDRASGTLWPRAGRNGGRGRCRMSQTLLPATAWWRSTLRHAGQCYFCERGQENLCDDLLFNNGAYAEFIRIPARIVAKNTLHVPDHVPLEHAALTEPLACAVHGFEDSRPRPGDTVAIIGGGPLGLMMLARRRAGRLRSDCDRQARWPG